MKLSFETQVFPISLEEALALAREHGFGGLCFGYSPRAAQRFLLSPDASRERRSLSLRLSDAGLSIPCLSTGSLLSDAANSPEECLPALEEALRLAGALSIPYVALYGAPDIADEAIRPVLEKLLDMALKQELVLLV